MKITRVVIKDYRGVEEVDTEIPPGGAVITGDIALGKTSFIRAIQAALSKDGIGPENIRIGAERAEILVNLGGLQVRRMISQTGTTLVVKNADGDKKSSPQAYLADLIGAKTLDPLAFYLADDKVRRRQLLEAFPVTVTKDDVMRWSSGEDDDADVEGHALEVVARYRKRWNDKRAEAKKKAEESKRTATTLRALAKDLAPSFYPAAGANISALETRSTAARKAVRDLEARDAAAAEAEKGAAGTRARIAALHAEASSPIADHPTVQEFDDCERRISAAHIERDRLRAALRAAEEEVLAASGNRDALYGRKDKHDQAIKAMSSVLRQAEDLETSLAGISALAVRPEDRRKAEYDLAEAEHRHKEALESIASEKADHAALAAEETAMLDEKEVEYDDRIVKAYDKAVEEIAGRSAMIPGLSIADKITMNGVILDNLSGSEQMKFAIDLARAANAKAQILIVDGLERIAGKKLDAFLKYATRDGWQMIATRVSDGELVMEAIEQ